MEQSVVEELIAFVRRIAEQKMCREEPDACEGQSGPYCGTHNWFLFDEDILKARALLERVASKS